MSQDREVAGVRCTAVLARLSLYLDGELPAAEVDQIRAHVMGCDVCERFGGRFAQAVHALRGLGSAPLDRERADRLRRRLAAR